MYAKVEKFLVKSQLPEKWHVNSIYNVNKRTWWQFDSYEGKIKTTLTSQNMQKRRNTA